MNLFRLVSFSVFYKSVMLLTSLSLIPLFSNYFPDKETTGLWLVYFSITSWFVFFDFGIGNAIRNNLTAFLVKGELKEAKRIFLDNFIFLNVIYFSLVSLCGLIYWSVDIGSLFLEFDIYVFIFFAVVGYQLPLKLFLVFLHANSRSDLACAVPLFHQIIFIMILIISIYFDFNFLGNLYYMMFFYSLTLVISYLPVVFKFFLFFKRSSNFKFIFNLRSFVNNINFGESFNFFLIQVCLLMLFGINEVIYLKFIGPESVFTYQSYYRLYSIFYVIFATISMPFWTSFRKSIVSDNAFGVKEKIKILNALFILLSLSCFLFSFFDRYFIELWIGEQYVVGDYSWSFVNFSFIFSFVFFTYVSSILNAFGKISIQFKGVFFAVLLKCLMILFFGVSGLNSVLLFVVLALFPVTLLLYFYSIKVCNEFYIRSCRV